MMILYILVIQTARLIMSVITLQNMKWLVTCSDSGMANSKPQLRARRAEYNITNFIFSAKLYFLFLAQLS